MEFLSLQPMAQFYDERGNLNPGQLLNVFPPFCTKESASGVSLQAVPVFERLGFLADFSRQIAGLPNDVQIKIEVNGSANSKEE